MQENMPALCTAGQSQKKSIFLRVHKSEPLYRLLIFLAIQMSLSLSLIFNLPLCELFLCLAELQQQSLLRLFVMFRAHNGHRDGTDGMDYQTNPDEKRPLHTHPICKHSVCKVY